MQGIEAKRALRERRRRRIRGRISGTPERPRLSMYRSARHVYAQVIDDTVGKTLASVSSFGGEKRADIEECARLGKELATRCKASHIVKVVFDKNGFAYHGRVKAFADGAREGGLDF